jgi:hypothetical protein
MPESGLPASKRNRQAKNCVHESGVPTRHLRPGNAADADGRESRAHTPQLRDLGSTAGEGANAGSTALAAFVHFHPCMTFFCWLADIQYPPGRREAKVWMLRHDSKYLYRVCVALDLIFTVIGATAVIAIAALVACKSLSISPAR